VDVFLCEGGWFVGEDDEVEVECVDVG